MSTILFRGGPKDGQRVVIHDDMPAAVSFGTDTGTIWYLPGHRHEHEFVQDYDYQVGEED